MIQIPLGHQPAACRSCGTPATGPFCSQCGAAIVRAGNPAEDDAPTLNQPRKHRLGVLIGSVVLVLALAGAGVAVVLAHRSPPQKRATLGGTLTLSIGAGIEGCFPGAVADKVMSRLGAMIGGESFPCPDGPGGGFADIRDGATVLVKDSAGRTIATGALIGGTATAKGTIFKFAVPSVPTSDFYQVTIGSRGGQTYSRADLDTAGWSIALALGS